jgi:hypothetical protein
VYGEDFVDEIEVSEEVEVVEEVAVEVEVETLEAAPVPDEPTPPPSES